MLVKIGLILRKMSVAKDREIECVGGPFDGVSVKDFGSEFEASQESDPAKIHLYQKSDDGFYYHRGEGTMADGP